MYVYQQSEPKLWTVGYFKPDGKWEPESDHDSSNGAAARVAWLNGGGKPQVRSIEHADAIACGEEDEQCSNPGGHEWGYSDEDGAESATNRCLCVHCGADGDA